jgi:hypothetical protein
MAQRTADATLATLRGDVINIVLGTVFLAVGATACAIAAIRGGECLERIGLRKPTWLNTLILKRLTRNSKLKLQEARPAAAEAAQE